MSEWPQIAVLSGGVGGARFVDGLRRVVPREKLTVIANTGDDLWLWGLRICPDIDTILYTLAGLAPRERGWGIADDTFTTLSQMQSLGEDDWFALGDRDIATHLFRTARVRENQRLAEVTAELFEAHAVDVHVVPMTDEEAGTKIHSSGEILEFQEWLVKTRATEPCDEVILPRNPRLSREAATALENADLVLITPSNPFVSIDPILNCEGMRDSLSERTVIGVSPLIGGHAVKGPLADMFRQRGIVPTSSAVAQHYAPFLDGFVVADGDGDGFGAATEILETDILIVEDAERERLAKEVLEFYRSRW